MEQLPYLSIEEYCRAESTGLTIQAGMMGKSFIRHKWASSDTEFTLHVQ